VNNFAQPTSWPTPLAVLLVDNCGNAVSNAQVITTFSNGDPPLALNANGSTAGMYAGTWTPRNASGQVSIVANANASGFPRGCREDHRPGYAQRGSAPDPERHAQCVCADSWRSRRAGHDRADLRLRTSPARRAQASTVPLPDKPQSDFCRHRRI
jgi:hypothetical protein